MKCTGRALGLVLLLIFALPQGVPGLGTQLPVTQDIIPLVKSVYCAAIPERIEKWADPAFSFTHKFERDGRANYSIFGRCDANMTDELWDPPKKWTVSIRYQVDAGWDPKQRMAFEIGRIYDLGKVAPSQFQPGPPGTYTAFVVRSLCEADPWLNDTQCGLHGLGDPADLKSLVPRIKDGPWPLTKGAINVYQQRLLKAEYARVTEQYVPIPFAGKSGIEKYATQPKQTPPPTKPSHGATYKPEALQTLNRGQTKTVRVQVTNTGTLTWTPSGNNPIRLAYHWYKANTVSPGTAPPPPAGGIVVWEGRRTGHSGPLGPNQSTNPPIRATIVAPSSPGIYVLKWDMVQEYVGWFSQRGVATFDQTVVVK
jgi:hypothetical protein